MSFRALFTAGLAAFAPLASAYTTPKGDPTGNAIYEPGLNSIVPVGKPFTITWQPDTKGKVSLVLLHGPSTNVVPIQTIVESIDNTGSYDWTPDTNLAPNKTYYGIELIVDGTGQYQCMQESYGERATQYLHNTQTRLSSVSQTTTTRQTAPAPAHPPLLPPLPLWSTSRAPSLLKQSVPLTLFPLPHLLPPPLLPASPALPHLRSRLLLPLSHPAVLPP